MATDYAGQYAASHPPIIPANVTFVQRVEMGIIKAAENIYSEAFTRQTLVRQQLCNRVTQPGVAANFAPGWVEHAASQGFACDSTTTDANIDGVISSTWNLLAGA